MTDYHLHDSTKMHTLKERHLKHYALLSYLRSRCIDEKVAMVYCKEVYYTFERRTYYALAIKNLQGGYEVHNSYFKGTIGKSTISIIHSQNIGVQSGCCLFMDYIDFLSYKMMEGNPSFPFCVNTPCDYIILNCINNLKHCLIRLENYKYIHLFLKHNTAGRVIRDVIVGLFKDKVIDESHHYSEYRSLNQYLLCFAERL